MEEERTKFLHVFLLVIILCIFMDHIYKSSLFHPCLSCNFIGVHYQYDSMAYPEVAIPVDVADRLASMERARSQLKVPIHETMQFEALPIYLVPHRDSICKYKVSDIESVSTKMICIFTQLNDQCIWTEGERKPHIWKCTLLSQVNNKK